MEKPPFTPRIKEEIQAPQKAIPHVIPGPVWTQCLEELPNTVFLNSPRGRLRDAEEQAGAMTLNSLVSSWRPPAVFLHLDLLAGYPHSQLPLSQTTAPLGACPPPPSSRASPALLCCPQLPLPPGSTQPSGGIHFQAPQLSPSSSQLLHPLYR